MPPVTTAEPPAGVPTIAEWTRIAAPDHTVAVTGDQISAFNGQDTEFFVYGQTKSGSGSDATMANGSLLRLDGPRAAVTLPANTTANPFPDDSMYLMWPSNANGVGRPVRINGTEAIWAGPDIASIGDTVVIHGQNLTFDGVHSSVFLELRGATEDPPFTPQWIEATGNPYRIEFQLPGKTSGLITGEYDVWVHNRHGGDYGWSRPVALTIRDRLPTLNSTKTFTVTDVAYGAVADDGHDDTVAIQKAIDAAHKHAYDNPGQSGTIFFPAGTYDLSSALAFNKEHIILEGESGSIIRATPQIVGGKTIAPENLFQGDNVAKDITIRNLTLKEPGYLTEGPYNGSVVRLRGSEDVRFENVTFDINAPQVAPFQIQLDFQNSTRITLENCDFITNGNIDLVGATQVRINDCVFEGVYDSENFILLAGSGEVSVTNCVAKDYNYDTKSTDANGYSQARLVYASGSFNENIYIANNTTHDLTPPPSAKDHNSGEQLLFEAPGPSFYGTPSDATSTSVTLLGLATDYKSLHTRVTASIVEGKGLGQRREVIAIDKSTGEVEIAQPWNVLPDSTSVVVIGQSQQNVVIYDNDLDGKEIWLTKDYLGTDFKTDPGDQVASSAIQASGLAHFHVVNNRMTDVRNGIYMTAAQWMVSKVNGVAIGIDPRPLFESDFFNYFADNQISNSTSGVLLATHNTNKLGGVAANGLGSAHLGTTIRNNTFAKMKKNYTPSGTFETRSHAVGLLTDFQHRATDLTIVEDNKYPENESHTEDNKLVGVDLYGEYADTSFGTIIRNNDFTGLTQTDATGVQFDVEGTPALYATNKWGKATAYDGSEVPGALFELPMRVIRDEWTSGTLSMSAPIFNVGTAKSSVTVWSDSSWLVAEAPGKMGAETSSTIGLEANLSGLGEGSFTATVFVDDSTRVQTFTVVVSVASGDFGPHDGVLPNLRRDRATTIEAEHFDRGGNNVGYYDSSGSGHVSGGIISDPHDGDWYDYTVNVPANGWYRAQLRARPNTSYGGFTLDYGSTYETFFVPSGSDWVTVDSEQFIYLNYGVQTVRLNVTSTAPDLDWIRFSPAASKTAGTPVPFGDVPPLVTRAYITSFETESYDSGGAAVGYNDTTTGNAESALRGEENVDLDDFATGAHAARGVAGEWLNYTINVERPGTYFVQFKVANTDSGGAIRFQSPNATNLFSDGSTDLAIPNTGDSFDDWEFLRRRVTFSCPGLQTVQIKFQTNSTGSGVAAQIDRVDFYQGSLLVGPLLEPVPFVTPTPDIGDKTQIGTVFALNTPGYINTLRFWVSAEEEEITELGNQETHTVSLWLQPRKLATTMFL